MTVSTGSTLGSCVSVDCIQLFKLPVLSNPMIGRPMHGRGTKEGAKGSARPTATEPKQGQSSGRARSDWILPNPSRRRRSRPLPSRPPSPPRPSRTLPVSRSLSPSCSPWLLLRSPTALVSPTCPTRCVSWCWAPAGVCTGIEVLTVLWECRGTRSSPSAGRTSPLWLLVSAPPCAQM